jgi:ribosomal protein S18 acetylase RimI-like enzyme
MLQREISIPPDQQFGGKCLWTVSSRQLGIQINAILQQQARQRDFSATYLDSACETAGLYSDKPDHTTIVLGTMYRFEGFVLFYTRDAAPDVGHISLLEGLNGKGLRLMDKDGEVVTPETLRRYPGYSEYSGQGAVCSVGFLEAFYKRQGIGTLAVRYLQENCDFELIELEATGEGDFQIEFYEKCGFVDANIDVSDGSRLAMVWHNPKYRDQQR